MDSTCTVGKMRTLMDSVANVVPYINLTLANGLASFSAFDTHQSVLCTAQLPVAFDASGCAHMHVPSCRAALRSVNGSTPLFITIDNDKFTLAWDNQRHTYTHIRLGPSPELAPCTSRGTFCMPSNDLLKFARDTKADLITFQCDDTLRIRAETDVCTSEYTAQPFDDGEPVSPAPSSITCTTRNVVSVAKASLFHKTVILRVCVNEVVFMFRKDLSTHVSFVLARAM